MSLPIGGRQLVLVDGRSGAGKTQWARELEAEGGFFLFSLDDVYPGWDGLAAGSQMALRGAILPWLAGETGRVRQWDWERSAAGDWIEVDPGIGLIVEGCGSISIEAAAVATKRVWVEAVADIRRERVLERDGEVTGPHWQRWALQEDRFYALNRSRELADLVVET